MLKMMEFGPQSTATHENIVRLLLSALDGATLTGLRKILAALAGLFEAPACSVWELCGPNSAMAFPEDRLLKVAEWSAEGIAAPIFDLPTTSLLATALKNGPVSVS